ncbi:hypothetical protein KAR50_05970 [Periweissella fabaria]|uniref:Uncharacterized protein n=1 Tax=Periweissella fabaria TaxID=546157 RepID=A0ABM8Z5L3_9LACO|nr:hypothetical protein [Periweissella fabaria]MCM0597387.1 hypothetical protein [Periweissella fabaria]CAH0416107.1 hypothetical protein WFA24289_00406 [Periweissella fabaria]
MEPLCACPQITTLNVEADMGAEPLWCAVCGDNLDPYDFPFSSDLQAELTIWANDFGSWVDWETEQLIPGAQFTEVAHNQAGRMLTTKVQETLGSNYQVKFIPSMMYQAND